MQLIIAGNVDMQIMLLYNSEDKADILELFKERIIGIIIYYNKKDRMQAAQMHHALLRQCWMTNQC